MNIQQAIDQKLPRLPLEMQQELLDFMELLLAKQTGTQQLSQPGSAPRLEHYFRKEITHIEFSTAPPGYPALRIKQFRLRNIGVFSDTGTVEFSTKVALLLGDNAAGKSTLLKGLALAAVGSEAANEVEAAVPSYLRKGTTQGSIEVLFELIPDPNAYPEEYGCFATGLRIQAGTDRFTPLPDDEMTLDRVNGIERLNELRNENGFSFGLICAYGATRTFSDSRFGVDPELIRDENEWVIPLFRWDARVVNSELLSRLFRGDLRNIQDAPDILQPELREAVAAALKRLLPALTELPSTAATDLQLNHIDLKFAELSDGYRSLLTILGHFIRSAFKAGGWQADPTQIHGIVVIDEVDLHLHPAWQRRVLGDLQAAFPNVQFIASTHSPLVAGALDSDMIYLLETQDGASTIQPLSTRLTETESMKAWRADQILTGPGFGLESSASLKANEWEEEYDALCDMAPAERSEEQQQRLDELSALLDREIPRWQETPRERAAAQHFEQWAMEKALSREAIEDTLQLLRQLDVEAPTA